LQSNKNPVSGEADRRTAAEEREDESEVGLGGEKEQGVGPSKKRARQE